MITAAVSPAASLGISGAFTGVSKAVGKLSSAGKNVGRLGPSPRLSAGIKTLLDDDVVREVTDNLIQGLGGELAAPDDSTDSGDRE
jgi:hypothetical protein